VNLTLGDLQSLPRCVLCGPSPRRGATFSGVSTDSRTIARGNLFVALRGGRFDGHDFIHTAIARGARAVVVDSLYGLPDHARVPHLVVENTTTALGELALIYRRKFSIPVVAVGGSNGKTTTKEMIARILARRYSVLSSQGNLNNEIGVPQTLFRLRRRHDVAVVEIGTNHPGEIGQLCKILEPTHGLLTTIGKEHLEFFHSIDRVAREEGSLYEALRGTPQGTAFVNADDPRIVAMAHVVRRRVPYGLHARAASVRGSIENIDAVGRVSVSLRHRGSKRRVVARLRIPGEHHALNAVAAAAVGVEFGVGLTSIQKSLESFSPASKRMEVFTIGGFTVLDDTYNANPDSMIAALRTLAVASAKGKRIAVLADMLELGTSSQTEHLRIGREAVRLKIDHVLTHGESARQIQLAVGGRSARHYERKDLLSESLARLVAPGDIVLVKGSRGMKMEDVVTFIRDQYRHGQR
jgi:UDP-N-acetylmuramoyl-tripeptide--D-alanyl-D-alanine ligase